MELLELITQEPETRITCSFDKIGMDGCIPMIDAQILLGYVFNNMFITADKVYPLFLTVPLNDTNFPNLYNSMADMNMVQKHLKEIQKIQR